MKTFENISICSLVTALIFLDMRNTNMNIIDAGMNMSFVSLTSIISSVIIVISIWSMFFINEGSVVDIKPLALFRRFVKLLVISPRLYASSEFIALGSNFNVFS